MIACTRCQRQNPADAAFCQECGSRLEAPCTGCGATNQLGAKFCKKCGQPLVQTGSTTEPPGTRLGDPKSYTPKHLAEKILTSRAALEGERKQVTVLFADLKGSMELSGGYGMICREAKHAVRTSTGPGEALPRRPRCV